MRETRILMGMPITVEIVGTSHSSIIELVFAYFRAVDARFSTYKESSEISRFNRGEISPENLSENMKEVLRISAQTRDQTKGFFEIRKPDGSLDPSGIVKGWAIKHAAGMISAAGLHDFYVEAGGDIQASGKNEDAGEWRVGIRSPFVMDQIIKVVTLRGQGMATSGNYIRGDHIYNPHDPAKRIEHIVSLSVIGPDILEADRFATAAFAMGEDGIAFLENRTGLEGYMVTADGIATQTSGFGAYVIS
ncbi:MAG: FAD:protein FMN transferase [Alphaproteobacteria bacterium]|nr:FAD:protein FMN transferase [Alphaproteobacteria bacterium]